MSASDNNPPPITLVLDRLRSAHNVGNIFRIAEAVGVREIIACGYTPAPPHPKLVKTAMGTESMTPCRTFPDAAGAVAALRAEGVAMVLAAEPSAPGEFAWRRSYRFPLALILGNEALGVSPEALAAADGLVGLPMAGSKASINVGNAAAAILYAIVARTSPDYGPEPERNVTMDCSGGCETSAGGGR